MLHCCVVLQVLREELNNRQHRLEHVDKAGAYLISKSHPDDAVQIQSDVDHLQQVLEQVLARMASIEARPGSALPVVSARLKDNKLQLTLALT